MEAKDLFNEYGFLVVKNVLSEQLAEVATTYTLLDEANDKITGDIQVPEMHSKYGDILMESILISMIDIVSEATGLDVLPTYSYYRVYRSGSSLKKHRDRVACEISASLCLGYSYPEDYIGWPLYVEDEPIIMEPGDLVIYRGIEMNHWRDSFDVPEGDYFLSQVFLHYVDANGKFADHKYDRRPRLGLKKDELNSSQLKTVSRDFS